MRSLIKPITSLEDAIEVVREQFLAHPERNRLLAAQAAMEGRLRPHATLYLNHLAMPDDTSTAPTAYALPEVQMPPTTEGDLARELVGLLGPLDLDNPISPCLGLGRGTGTLVTAFGIPLNEEAGGTPAFTKRVETVLGEEPPDPATAGLMPSMLARIDRLKSLLPPFFKISLPDMQGPYNIAHAVAGEDALVGPYLDPEMFRQLMERVTDHWIASRRLLVERIGAEYLDPAEANPHIAECSVNLTRAEIYRDHILPHDLRIVAEFGPPRIHTCSGPHVFKVTLEHLPLIVTECGYIPSAVAGWTTVDEAFEAVRGRPILLNIGQELPKDFATAREIVQQDLARYADHPRLLFAYTGMEWRRKDRPAIRELHQQLDAWWAEQYG